MREVKSLDEVFTFGDQLSFLIPHEWIEGESGDDDTYLYHYPDSDSGWLRVTLLTLKGCADPAERLHDIFGKKQSYWVDEETENLVRTFEKDTEQDGDLLHMYYWQVGNFVKPDLVQEAIFSYAILRDRVKDKSNLRMISVLSQVLPRAKFYPVANRDQQKPC